MAKFQLHVGVVAHIAPGIKRNIALYRYLALYSAIYFSIQRYTPTYDTNTERV